jgi:hypothetical protein
VIDLREINETIDDIKRKGGTVNDAITLAMLYIAKDHMQHEDSTRTPTETVQNYAQAAEMPTHKEIPTNTKKRRTSPFLTACEGVPVEDVLDIMDEHMEAINLLYPKEYEAILRKLENRI